MTKVYISGPMTGRPDHNFPAFNAAAKTLRELEYEVVNPADKGIVDGWKWEDYLRYDLKLLADCDAIYMLEGWQDSPGADLEAMVAHDLGMAFLGPWYYDRSKPAVSLRTELLTEAESLVSGDRNNTYGAPHQDFQRTAGILTALGFGFSGEPIQAHHTAMILAAVKLSRLAWSPGKRDSWVDLAGYAACGHEAYELTNDA